MPRVGLTLSGVVQGVGLRPAAHRRARELGLGGAVWNTALGVRVELEGEARAIEAFEHAARRGFDTPALVERIDREVLVERGETSFRIVPSRDGDARLATCAPDLAPCALCRAELDDPASRRFGHPFIGCAACGPRFSIVEELPYDRANTTMRPFALCPRCARELEDPDDSRHHAQPIACPDCGPRLRFEGEPSDAPPLEAALARLARGDTLALLGVGGFQLLVDATDEAAVARLRHRKRRPDKPFAVLFADLAAVEQVATVSEAERSLLASSAAPIVLLRTHAGARLAPSVARGGAWTGAMLPSSPLHLLLARGFGRPLVCTSGNVTEEPLCIDAAEARARLGPSFDAMLTHDRRVARPLDDSVMRVSASGPIVLRRARGLVPRSLAFPEGPPVVALGGHLKAVGVVAHRGRAVPTAHIGDLGSPEARDRLETSVEDLLGMLRVRPAIVACDLHPDYGSTEVAERLAARYGVALVRVQHHHAHVASVVAEHMLRRPVLGFAWDGTGLGLDGSPWGGEALVVAGSSATRIGSLEAFPIPPGDGGAREPAFVAASALVGLGFDPGLARALPAETIARAERGRPLLAPTSSVGRLFDVVAALLGVATRTTFEAQAAIALEQACAREPHAPYPVELEQREDRWTVCVGPILRGVLVDLDRGAPVPAIAARFHETLAVALVAIAERNGLGDVVLSGGCFQNAILLDRAHARLTDAGFTVYAARDMPPNDGGLALGQAWVAAEVLGVSRDPG